MTGRGAPGDVGMVDRSHEHYRVVIDVEQIRANLLRYEGGQLSELQIRNWLRSVGFKPDNDGRTWLADRECLHRLHHTEILEKTSVATNA